MGRFNIPRSMHNTSEIVRLRRVVEKLQEGESVYIDDDLFTDCYIEERLADEYDEWQEELEAEKELRDEN